jgi:hypothetical protein
MIIAQSTHLESYLFLVESTLQLVIKRRPLYSTLLSLGINLKMSSSPNNLTYQDQIEELYGPILTGRQGC